MTVMNVRADVVAMKVCWMPRVMLMLPAMTWNWRVACEVAGLIPPLMYLLNSSEHVYVFRTRL